LGREALRQVSHTKVGGTEAKEAGVGLISTCDDSEEGRFAAAVGGHEADSFADVEIERDGADFA